MQYVYAAMLLHSAKKEINEAAVEKIINAAGLELDKGKVKALVEALKEVNIDEVIKQASTVVAVAPSAGSAKAEAKEEVKDDKKTEEEAAAGLGSLFG
ncbi:MAG: 50S ribosomal protein P1 [Candidatus ainarchaeum sp.]|nr:50S ribosomal protein P1 [Candidatus ainarchaeum sp.]